MSLFWIGFYFVFAWLGLFVVVVCSRMNARAKIMQLSLMYGKLSIVVIYLCIVRSCDDDETNLCSQKSTIFSFVSFFF
jgi:hypothetical protein